MLNQRAAFLRPDSLVAYRHVDGRKRLLIRDTDVGWVSAKTTNSIPTVSTACATNPNYRSWPLVHVRIPLAAVPRKRLAAPMGLPRLPTTARIRPISAAGSRSGALVMNSCIRSHATCWFDEKDTVSDQTFGDMDCDCAYANSIGAPCDKGSRSMPNPLYSTTVGQLNSGQSIAGYPNSMPRADNSSIFLAGVIGVPGKTLAARRAARWFTFL